jgi:hypothetical protein
MPSAQVSPVVRLGRAPPGAANEIQRRWIRVQLHKIGLAMAKGNLIDARELLRELHAYTDAQGVRL